MNTEKADDCLLDSQQALRAISAAHRRALDTIRRDSDRIDMEIMQMADVILREATAGFRRTIMDAYGQGMPPDAVRAILEKAWSGIPYPARVWRIIEATGVKLQRVLAKEREISDDEMGGERNS